MNTSFLATIGFAGLIGAISLLSGTSVIAVENASPNSTAAAGANQGTPIIQFETTFFDFGKLSALGKVSGVFKFKNAGTAVLKMDPPRPSCGCTDANVKPDTLAPGESGEISYTINLDHPMGQVQKHISVYSNDPKTPDVQLTMQLDCSPLYELSPKVLHLVLRPDQAQAESFFEVTRNDGKPCNIERLTSTQKGVSVALDASVKPEMSSDRVNVIVHRPSTPSTKVMANIQVWAAGETNHPMDTLLTWCDIQGELTATPPQMYWVIPNLGNSITNYPAESLTHTMELKSVLDQPVTIKNVRTTVKGMSVQTIPKDGGKTFELILKFNELPHNLTSGNIIVETSSGALPKLEVPVSVAAAQ